MTGVAIGWRHLTARMLHRFVGLTFAILLSGLAPTAARAAAPTPASVRSATGEELAVLTQALEKTAADLRRWAYTESRVIRDEKGKVKTDVVVRVDPSKPYAEQWTPITVNGKPPSAGDLKKYRRMGERTEKAAANPSGDARRPSLGEVIDLRTALVRSESAEHWIFEVPLKKDGNDRFPPEKFEVLVRVGKASKGLENIAVRLRSSFRSKLLLKVKSGDGMLDFAVVNPKYPPTLISISGDASASVLFVSVGGELELKRTELKHVKPFDERFEVQIGTLKAIDF
jgi:hypothetical protein